MQKATVGGILTIVASGIGILIGLYYLLYAIFFSAIFESLGSEPEYAASSADAVLVIMWIIFGGIFLFYAGLGALGIIGGICAIKKKSWGWALAGAISSSILFYFVGIAAVVLVSMAAEEFKKTRMPVPQVSLLAA